MGPDRSGVPVSREFLSVPASAWRQGGVYGAQGRRHESGGTSDGEGPAGGVGGEGTRDGTQGRRHRGPAPRTGGPPAGEPDGTARTLGAAHHRGETPDRDDQGGDFRRGD